MTERLSLEGLRYARAVAETKSFTSAARAYGVTQPALSNGIAKLEERLGVRLFERSPQGVTPTAGGERILGLVERALDQVDAVIAEARRQNDPAGGHGIRMGVSPLIGQELVARAFAAVRELPTPRDVVLREAQMSNLREELIARELDVVLMPSVERFPRYEQRVFHSEPLALVESPAQGDGPIELELVADKQLILVPDTCGLTRFTVDLFASHDLPLHAYSGEPTSYGVLEQWVGLGLGAALLPESKLTSPEVPHRRLVEDGQDVEIFYAAIWPAGSDLAPDLELLARSLGAR